MAFGPGSIAFVGFNADGNGNNADTQPTVGFAEDSVQVLFAEGDDGTTTATITMERTGSTVGEVTFSGLFVRGGMNADDFGGALPPATFSGVIPDGESSVTFTMTFSGDTTPENHEWFQFFLTSATDSTAANVALGRTQATVNIINDDELSVVRSGETVNGIGLTGQQALTIEEGATANNIGVAGDDFDVTINNAGRMGVGGAVLASSQPGHGKITLNNEATGTLSGGLIVPAYPAADSLEFVLNNDGQVGGIIANQFNAAYESIIINNETGGVISADRAVRLAGDTTINNAGTIISTGGGREGIEYSGDNVVVNNLAGGLIEGQKHAITGGQSVTITNAADATMIGRNGSAINIDSGIEQVVTVKNHGLLQGNAIPGAADGDGDAVDVDGLAAIENWGTIEGLGHSGVKSDGPNVAEGVAIGGGTVINHEGGTIYGYGRAIQIDNSSESGAFAAAKITNAGTIKGDGNLPRYAQGTPIESHAPFIDGREAINIIGTHADSLNNSVTGQIIGGVSMGGGNDVLINKGTMTATGGSAVNLGNGDDTFEFHAGSTVTGLSDGGEGNDTLKLVGPGVGTVGANVNFENLDVQSGTWAIESDAYDAVNVATGAMVMSQLKLADQGEMTVATGGSVLVTNGSDAIVAEGAATIENAGLIQALGVSGAELADAISISGGEVYNKVGGIILSQGVAIASEEAPVPGVVIVNEGMIQSLSGEAIALSGDAGDLLVNTRTGAIIGSVSTGGGNDLVTNQGSVVAANGTAFDLGDGNDTLNLHGGSTVAGKIVLGAGNDVLSSNSASNLDIEAGEGQDSIATGEGDDRIIGGAGIDLVHAGGGNDLVDGGADNDRLQGGDGDDELLGGAGDDILIGGAGNDRLDGGDGIDTADYASDRVGITVDFTAGTAVGDEAGSDELTSIENVIGGSGNDTFLVSTDGPVPTSIDGGAGDDTVRLLGNGTGALATMAAVENLIVQEGTWSVAASDYSNVTIEDGATVTSTVALNNDDTLTVENGGKLVAGTAITWSGGGDAVVENAGLIEASSRVFNTTNGATGSFTFNNLAGGVVRGEFDPQQEADANATITINNAGIMEASGRVIDFRDLADDGAKIVINNQAGGIIRQTEDDTDVIRPGQNTTVNNWGSITTAEGFVGEGDLIDFQEGTGGKVNNYAGGWMEGSRHVVTGDNSVTVVNEGTMIGRNGSAVNIDNGGSEAEKVFITNRGTMEGRSAELSDSDGDAVDVDGLVQVLNYGRIAGMGAEGYHDGEPNVSEGIAIGGGSILNYGSDAVIYGYGRGIQVDNSSNSNALGKTFINNEGLIQGDGHGPEGVDPEDAAQFDLRGNEAINLVGDYADEVLNQSTGRIVGGVSMGGGNDHLQSLGSFTATGGSAIDMGAGNDTVYFYTGTTVQGTVLLGTGDDLLLSTADTDLVIDAGDGNDQMYLSGYLGGDDTLSGGAGEDRIYSGLGEDRIDGGADNDSLYGEAGDDLLIGGSGDDIVDGGADDDVIFGDAGNDTLIGGLGNDVIKGGAGNDTFVITSTADGRDSYDGGDGIDTIDYGAVTTAVNLTLKNNGTSKFSTDTIENVENVIGGSAADKLTGNSLDNVLTGNAGDDTLKGAAGNDTLIGGAGNDTLDGGAGNDQLSGGFNDDILKGAAGNDTLDGGEGNDNLDGGANDDILLGGAGNDVLKGGAGNDTITGGAGNDTLTGGGGHDQYLFSSIGDGIDTITDFKVRGGSEDQLVLSASMFEGFTGDDAFDLIGSGFLQAVQGSCGNTLIRVDVDGGGDSFQTLAYVDGNITNGMLADHTIVDLDPIA